DGLPPNDAGTNDRPGPNQQADGSAWGIHTGAGGIAGDASYKTFLGRVARNDNFSRIVPYDFEIRFTAAGSTGNLAFTSENNVQLPFEVWNTGIGTPNDPSDDFELVTLVNDVNGNEKFDLDSVDHPLSGGDNDPETDWFYIYDVSDHTPGHAGYDLAVSSGFNNTGDEIMARLVFVNWNGGSISDPTFPNNVNAQMPETGTIFRIETTKPNTDNDVFTFTAPKVSSNDSAAQADVNKINVFPNPYYGVNPQEINKYNRFVTFSHLPQKAVIRIFNLAGQLIRTIRKDSPGQFQPWDLLTDNSFPVAGGLYIVYIDMPDLGKSKILKVAIVQEQQILDHF
ncbi:MAG TPA: T9SS type A sorting domain-containing protein, partial [Ignavibacteriaceae bacterium]|nr:T9SS type A sorting domain-containing protein [Ignavibacteriaceae bacterium]